MCYFINTETTIFPTVQTVWYFKVDLPGPGTLETSAVANNYDDGTTRNLYRTTWDESGDIPSAGIYEIGWWSGCGWDDCSESHIFPYTEGEFAVTFTINFYPEEEPPPNKYTLTVDPEDANQLGGAEDPYCVVEVVHNGICYTVDTPPYVFQDVEEGAWCNIEVFWYKPYDSGFTTAEDIFMPSNDHTETIPHPDHWLIFGQAYYPVSSTYWQLFYYDTQQHTATGGSYAHIRSADTYELSATQGSSTITKDMDTSAGEDAYGFFYFGNTFSPTTSHTMKITDRKTDFLSV